MPRSLTVSQLIHQLQTLDPNQPVRLAINPDWPFAHFIGGVIEGEGDNGSTAYLAENGQEGYLPLSVLNALGWHEEHGATRLNAEDRDQDPWYLDAQEIALVVTELLAHPGWTCHDNDAESVYTSPGGHLTIRCADSGWSFEARRAPGGKAVWSAAFDANVPTVAIRAFASVLLGFEPGA
ncbi:DUF317 domain-containing protein [Streptomyces hygroscopicus]|uniref:DUF317 domain-containing protein n=1 Tax=Streptomyces hygroscopicus TaxID=1912 RepID=UPI0007C7B565|nr:DUF317 domain-containing protein [Streptomyces hygroscopicus]